jgi:hypothetical protein
MIYIVLDLDTANYVGAFRSEAEALAGVREAVKRFGRSYAASWGLASKDADGRMEALAEGEGLIDRAFAVPA